MRLISFSIATILFFFIHPVNAQLGETVTVTTVETLELGLKNSQIKDQINAGNFKTYPPDILSILQLSAGRFDTPGKSIIFSGCMEKANSSETHSQIINSFNELKYHPQITKPQKTFLQKAVDRIINMSLQEKDTTCTCSADNLWTVLSNDQKIIFDKMVLGTSLSKSDLGELKKNAKGFIPDSKGGPGACLLRSLDLYDEMKKLMRL